MMRGRSVVAALALAAGAAAAQAQVRPDPGRATLRQALVFEREGRYEEAAVQYQHTLASDPGEAAALLGLERVLTRLGRLGAIEPYVRRAVAARPELEALRELEFRVAAAVHGPDSGAAAAARWIAARPESTTPYWHWAFWLAERGDMAAATAVLDDGRARVGDGRIAPYAAQLLVAMGDWAAAVREWGLALDANPALVQTAGVGLAQVPPSMRDEVLDIVLGAGPSGDPTRRQLAAELLLRWDRAEEAWTLLDGALPEDDRAAVAALRRFADRARQVRTAAGARARGFALERLAERLVGPDAARTRLEAARAFADAGELAAAERMLDRVPPVGGRPDDAAAMATLIRVLADAGRIEEAEAKYREWTDRLSVDDRAAIRETLAWQWVLAARLDRAETVLDGDSSIGAQAVAGWIALYRGELARARALFTSAGPRARSRDEATRRARMLVLIQRIGRAEHPALGRALLTLAQGDTAAAVERLAAVAGALPPTGGRAEVLAHAGALALGRGDHAVAEPLLEAAVAADTTGPAAPSAELALASLLADTGRGDEAVARLEHLILAYPESAVVPQARRLLDQVRGLVPKS